VADDSTGDSAKDCASQGLRSKKLGVDRGDEKGADRKQWNDADGLETERAQHDEP